jgi:hypothetical protein
MQIRLSQLNHLTLGHGRGLLTLILIAGPVVAAYSLFRLQPDSLSGVAFLFLPLVLFGALGAGRELLTPSLKELAFYSFAMVAAMLIWPSARLAVLAHEASGLVMLAAFMGFILALALALGVLAVKLLASHDGET